MKFFALLSKSFHFKANNKLVSTRFFSKMNVIPIEALSDNYMYLLVDESSKQCAAVDPVEPTKVLKLKYFLSNKLIKIINYIFQKILDYVNKLNLKLTKVLTTHHHW
jgi:hydroxyacylglutathione hydrolase